MRKACSSKCYNADGELDVIFSIVSSHARLVYFGELSVVRGAPLA